MLLLQVERVAKECGAQLEYVPILLGALFRTIGAPNAPMMVHSALRGGQRASARTPTLLTRSASTCVIYFVVG